MNEEHLTQLIGKLLDKKLNPIVKTLDEVNIKIVKIDIIEQFLTFLSDKYDDLFSKVAKMEETNKLLVEENKYLRESLHDSSNNLDQLKQEINNIEQYSRRECLETRGIPIQSGESTDEFVLKIGEQIGVRVEENDISISHRLATGNRNVDSTKRDPAIIVKFVRRDILDRFNKAKTNLRNKTTRDIGMLRFAERKIYVAESLTQWNKKLFNKCLEAKKQLNYKFIWTTYGKIFLGLSTQRRN
ncbi:Hypothetical predicted protein [Paramuricea clavata]|uniref:Uncharacterized protein n=1 Tax=Paramuricea clavata TaxID=317549 RepID=A0A6S7HMX5_PARCT|nr:Hypothetical predicted protein [Paramuricea clavata]